MVIGFDTVSRRLVKASNLFGAIYRIIVRYGLGHIAPIVCTSIVFSIVAPSDGFGAFVAPFTGTIITLGNLEGDMPRLVHCACISEVLSDKFRIP